jgi:acyl carrier protein
MVNNFRLDEKDCPDELTIDTVSSWDSITHLMLIEKLENNFNIQITHNESIELFSEEDILLFLKDKVI